MLRKNGILNNIKMLLGEVIAKMETKSRCKTREKILFRNKEKSEVIKSYNKYLRKQNDKKTKYMNNLHNYTHSNTNIR